MTIYAIQAECGAVKIGFTSALSGDGRLSEMQVGNPGKLTLLLSVRGTHEQEQYLHFLLSRECIRGEWFRPSRRLSSLLAYMKTFGHTEGWGEAETHPEQWAEHVAQYGARDFESLNVEVTHESRWIASLKGLDRLKVEEVACDVEMHWRTEAPEALTLAEEHIVSEFLPSAVSLVSTRGDRHAGGGLAATVELLRTAPKTTWVWLSAFVHDLTRTGENLLARSVYRPEPLLRVIRAHQPPRWHHLSAALPRLVWVPRRCRLEHDEFVAACARTARLIATDWRAQCGWAPGSFSALSARRAAA